MTCNDLAKIMLNCKHIKQRSIASNIICLRYVVYTMKCIYLIYCLVRLLGFTTDFNLVVFLVVLFLLPKYRIKIEEHEGC